MLYLKKYITTFLLALPLFISTGCSPSPEDIKSLLKESVQEKLDTDSDFSKYNMTVTDANLVQVQGNKYRAYVDIMLDGKSHKVAMDVYADRQGMETTAMWEAKPGAFAFIAQKEIASALDEFNDEMDEANAKFQADMDTLETELNNDMNQWQVDTQNEINDVIPVTNDAVEAETQEIYDNVDEALLTDDSLIDCYYVQTLEANVRSSIEISDNVLFKVKRNDEVCAVDISNPPAGSDLTTQWYQINVGGNLGWISGKVLSKERYIETYDNDI